MQATQVDDTLGGGDDEFAALEEEKSKRLNGTRERIFSRFSSTVFGWISTSLEDTFYTRRSTVPISEKQTQALCLKVGYKVLCVKWHTWHFFENAPLSQVTAEIIDKKALSVVNETIRKLRALPKSYIFL